MNNAFERYICSRIHSELDKVVRVSFVDKLPVSSDIVLQIDLRCGASIVVGVTSRLLGVAVAPKHILTIYNPNKLPLYRWAWFLRDMDEWRARPIFVSNQMLRHIQMFHDSWLDDVIERFKAEVSV
jgi:hypothetical protein